ncbi:MAG: hypothetical protein LUO91_03660, partial [Methanomicrobiales archaeon]|nr:hypothetical protein [Methanomicrobiales archaeon]
MGVILPDHHDPVDSVQDHGLAATAALLPANSIYPNIPAIPMRAPLKGWAVLTMLLLILLASLALC